MPTHWTYENFNADDDLFQGDIISRTPALEDLLARVHSYFLDSKFTAFVVITQSCDLVRRGESCKAEHINLAVVRELEPTLPDIVGKVAGAGVAGVYISSARLFAVQLLKRIINQNELARGLFYLHPDGDVGIATPSVVMLRISIAVRQEHFDMLREARRGRLTAEFRNKIGWLCGNLFSRVDTPDWNDKHPNVDDTKHAEALLRSIDGDGKQFWIPQSWVDAAARAGVDLKGTSREQAIEVLRQHAPPEPMKIGLERVRAISLQLLAVEQANKLKELLPTDEFFLSDVTNHLAAHVESLTGIGAGDIRPRIAEDTSIIRATTQDAFLAAKAFLETDRNAAITKCQEMLSRRKVPRSVAEAIRAIVKAASGDEWPRSAARLAALEDQVLYPETIIARLAPTIQKLQNVPELKTIEKLASRLGNDQEFISLFRANPLAVPISSD